MKAIRAILVPTDFSDPANAALAYARDLATHFGSRLHLLHVVSLPQTGWPAEGNLSWPTLLADLEADARVELERLIPKDDPVAERVTFSTEIGVPVEGILDYAAANPIDLIVIGTHGRGLVGHMLLGSVAERVVRRARVPVLTLHGPTPAPAGHEVTEAGAAVAG
jgi:nucleotide-binding universal stress UspA family protein